MHRSFIVTYLFILVFMIPAVGQNANIDSLARSIDTSEPDTQMVKTSYELAAELWYVDVNRAYHYAQQGLKMAEELEWKKGIALMRRNLSAINVIQGDYGRALINANNSLEHYKEINDIGSIGKLYNNLGIIYHEINLTDKALSHYKKSMTIFEQVDNLEVLSNVYNNIGIVYNEIGKNDSALYYFNQSLSIAKELKDSTMLSFNYTNIGYVHKSEGDYGKTLEYFYKAQSLNRQLGLKDMMVNDNVSIGEVLVDMGKYGEAEALLLAGLTKAIDQDLKPLRLDYYKALARASEGLGKYRDALDYQKKYVQLKDSMFSSEQEEILLQQQAREKDLEIELLNRENEYKEESLAKLRSKNDLLIIIALGLIVTLIIALYQTWQRMKINKQLQKQTEDLSLQKEKIIKKNRQLEVKNRKLDELNDEKNYLLKVAAHDLKAPLNRISGLVELCFLDNNPLSKDQKLYLSKMANSSKRLSEMINKILDIHAIESNKINVKLDKLKVTDLVDRTTRNFQKEADKKNIQLKVDKTANGAVAMLDKSLTIQIFENLLSNAIKFSPENSEVKVRVTNSNGTIRTEVKDQGPGIKPEERDKLFKKFQKLSAKPTANESSSGIGLSIVKKLVEAMNGQVTCESSPGSGSNFIVEFKQAG